MSEANPEAILPGMVRADRPCVRCGKPVEPGRRKYCSEACADSSLRAAIKLRKLSGVMRPKLLYRLTSYRDT